MTDPQCCLCKTPLKGNQVICNDCWQAWPKGMSFGEYTNMPYVPKPKKVPMFKKALPDYPRPV